MDPRETILAENFDEYYVLAVESFDKKRFNSATTLFFKAIAAALDLYILQNDGFIPSSHSDRFQYLRDHYSNLYSIADRDFPFYQDSYTARMDEESAMLLYEDAKKLKGIIKLN